MKTSSTTLALLAGMILQPVAANAAFVVEAHLSGKANANFAVLPGAGNATGATASTPSAAVGLLATNSLFGSNNTVAGVPDVYRFAYTPGVNADNTVLAAGTSLGNSAATDADGAGAGPPAYAIGPQLATGLVGGASGRYNVYFTTPESINVEAAGSRFDISSSAGTITLNPVVLNSGATGPDEIVGGQFTGGANNRWLKLGTVTLNAGTLYTVTETSNVDAFVSQRAHGVMWEFAGPIPEPSSALLAIVGLSVIGLFRRRRKN